MEGAGGLHMQDVPQPEPAPDRPFLMLVEDVRSVANRGTLVTGRIESGIVRVGDNVDIAGTSDTGKAIVVGIEVMRRAIAQAGAGDYVGVLLRGRQEVRRGQMLAAPGSVERKD